MNSFTVNKIFFDAETVAEQLRSARQQKGLKLEKVAKDLGINFKYLEALERGQFERLPSGVYGKNFLREYALALGLDYRPLLKMFEAEVALSQKKQQQELFSKQVVKARDLWVTPKIAKSIIVLAAVAVCLTYLTYRLDKIVSPPDLVIESPIDNLTTKEHSIEVRGTVEPETELVINGEAIISDVGGSFSKSVDLKAGVNTIVITAEKKYGRNKTIKRQILVEK